MQDQSLLSEIIQQKIARQKQLNKLAEDLEVLRLDLSIENFFRWFGTAYFWIKRVMTLVFGILIIFLGLYLALNPEGFVEMIGTEKMVETYAQTTIDGIGNQLAQEHNELNSITHSDVSIMAKATSLIVLHYIEEIIQIFGIVFIVFGLCLLYISRLTKKMKRLSLKLRDAKRHSQSIIDAFRNTIAEEEQELVKLQEMASGH
jgi:sulfite exporter TauE/SafE